MTGEDTNGPLNDLIDEPIIVTVEVRADGDGYVGTSSTTKMELRAFIEALRQQLKIRQVIYTSPGARLTIELTAEQKTTMLQLLRKNVAYGIRSIECES